MDVVAFLIQRPAHRESTQVRITEIARVLSSATNGDDHTLEAMEHDAVGRSAVDAAYGKCHFRRRCMYRRIDIFNPHRLVLLDGGTRRLDQRAPASWVSSIRPGSSATIACRFLRNLSHRRAPGRCRPSPTGHCPSNPAGHWRCRRPRSREFRGRLHILLDASDTGNLL